MGAYGEAMHACGSPHTGQPPPVHTRGRQPCLHAWPSVPTSNPSHALAHVSLRSTAPASTVRALALACDEPLCEDVTVKVKDSGAAGADDRLLACMVLGLLME